MSLDNKWIKIKVIGVGGCGGNAINDMFTLGINGVEFVAANTDLQDLNKSLADVRLQLGEKLTRGRGAGADPEVGQKAAEEDTEIIKNILADTDMLFITAGMGGGTGTGAAPVIARIAKEMNILTFGVVTKPFQYEGPTRIRQAAEGIDNLRQYIDALIVIPNDKLFNLPDKKMSMKDAYIAANKVLYIAIKGIAEIINNPGRINIDFADIKNMLKNSGTAMLGYGEGTGENMVRMAMDNALNSPLLEKDVVGANKVIVNVTTGPDFGLREMNNIAAILKDAIGKRSDVEWGHVEDPEMSGKVSVTIIANNFMDEHVMPSQSINIEDTPSEVHSTPESLDAMDVPPSLRKNN